MCTKYIKAGYADRVHVAYGKVARNVSLDDSNPGATQIALYKPPVCAGSQAGRTVELVLCIAWRRWSWDSLWSISSMHTYSSWSGVGTLAPALVQHSCVEVWSPRHDFGSVLLSVRLQSRHRGYSAPGSGAGIMHTTSTDPCSSSL